MNLHTMAHETQLKAMCCLLYSSDCVEIRCLTCDESFKAPHHPINCLITFVMNSACETLLTANSNTENICGISIICHFVLQFFYLCHFPSRILNTSYREHSGKIDKHKKKRISES